MVPPHDKFWIPCIWWIHEELWEKNQNNLWSKMWKSRLSAVKEWETEEEVDYTMFAGMTYSTLEGITWIIVIRTIFHLKNYIYYWYFRRLQWNQLSAPKEGILKRVLLFDRTFRLCIEHKTTETAISDSSSYRWVCRDHIWISASTLEGGSEIDGPTTLPALWSERRLHIDV